MAFFIQTSPVSRKAFRDQHRLESFAGSAQLENEEVQRKPIALKAQRYNSKYF